MANLQSGPRVLTKKYISLSRIISNNTPWLSCPSRLYSRIFSIFPHCCEYDSSWEQIPPPCTSTTLPVCTACVLGRVASETEENSEDNSCLLGNNTIHLILISYFLESVLQIFCLPCNMKKHTV